MVSRNPTKDAARRSMSSMSRATLRTTNTKTLWNELHIDVLKGETATDVEWVENYGSTVHPAKQDEDENKGQQAKAGGGSSGGTGGGSPGTVGEQPEGDSAEPIVGYMNGARNHPVVLAVGDRRHRLKELEEGDVAQHRLKDDRQQVLLSKDGTYISTREDKKFRVALVPKETKDDQQQQGGQQTRGGGEQQQQGKQKKTYGQKSAKDDNGKSSVAIEQNGTTTYSQHGESYSSQKGGSDSTAHYGKDKKKSAQATDQHAHIRFKDHRIFNDEEGNWWTTPCLVKKDKYCKEG
jgi:phage gp45-like